MKGEIYNVGLSEANVSKRELCQAIQKQLPDFVIIEPEIVGTFIPEFEVVITEEALTEEQVGQVIDEIMNASVEDVIYLIDTLSVEQLDQVFEEVSVEQLTEILDSLSVEEVLDVIENIESVDALMGIPVIVPCNVILNPGGNEPANTL
jgi:hypothetical protein